MNNDQNRYFEFGPFRNLREVKFSCLQALKFREQHFLDIYKLFWTILLKEIKNKLLDGSRVDQGYLHKRQLALVAIAMFHSPRFYGKRALQMKRLRYKLLLL